MPGVHRAVAFASVHAGVTNPRTSGRSAACTGDVGHGGHCRASARLRPAGAGSCESSKTGSMTVKHDPILLDEHRGIAAQQATEIRRRLSEVEADQAALRARRTELEKFLIAAPAPTWHEAAEKARYLIGLFATTSLGRDPRRQKLIARVLDDFSRLAGEAAPEAPSASKSGNGDGTG
jgi:hypothetical protein